MLRVLHVVTDMNRGGLETMLMNYYRHIDRGSVQFDFLVHRQKRAAYDDEIEKLGGRIFRIQKLNPLSPSYYSALDDFFREHTEYNIVHAHLDCMSAYPLRAAKRAGVPVRIAHAHSTAQDHDWKFIFKLFSKRFISRYATFLFSCSEDAGKWMFGTDKITVLKNAIDTSKYAFDMSVRNEMRKKLQLEDAFVLGHVGRFSPAKNHDFLIDVFQIVKECCPDAKLLLVGDGAKRIEIFEKVRRLNLSKDVIFAGVCENVDELLQAMDIFVFPSLYEGFGIAALEAQTSGLPCVISKNVPNDCAVTADLTAFLPLDAGADEWADAVLTKRDIVRKDRSAEVTSKHMDIINEAVKLEEFYKKAYEKQF